MHSCVLNLANFSIVNKIICIAFFMSDTIRRAAYEHHLTHV